MTTPTPTTSKPWPAKPTAAPAARPSLPAGAPVVAPRPAAPVAAQQQAQAAPAVEESKPVASTATVAIEFVDRDGWPMTLTLTAPSGLLAITQAEAAKKKLIEVGAKPATKTAPAQQQQAQGAGDPPTCAIHKKPMARVEGKKGAFWSCHEKLEDGSFCPYKPPTR